MTLLTLVTLAPKGFANVANVANVGAARNGNVRSLNVRSAQKSGLSSARLFRSVLSHKRTWEFQRYNYHPALIFALFGPPIQPPETLGEALSKSPESTDSARAAHSLDNPATLPVESGLPVRF